MSDVDVPLDVGDFRLVDRRALDAFRSMRESTATCAACSAGSATARSESPFRREERYAGETKYPLRKMLSSPRTGSSASRPIRFGSRSSSASSWPALSFLLGVVFLVSKIVGLYDVPGLASIAVFVAFLGGIQLLLIGIMGEYVARIHDEVKGRPLYLVSDTQGWRPGLREYDRPMAVTSPPKLDAPKLRADFPIFEQEIHGKPLAYLDSAASSQKPRQVLDAMRDFYETSYANVHRGVYTLSERATAEYEGAREKVARS